MPGGQKMHSATSLQGVGLVRTVGPCAQTRVAIETHSWTSGQSAAHFERPAEQATKPRVKREAKWIVLCHTWQIWRSSRARTSCCPCPLLSDEFRAAAVLLTCSEGCGLRDVRLKVRLLLSAHAHCTILLDVLLIARAYKPQYPIIVTSDILIKTYNLFVAFIAHSKQFKAKAS